MKKNMIVFVNTLLICACLRSYSQTVLSGDIGGMTLDAFNSPYIIEKDIIISSGEETVIKAGAALVFKSFTGLTVFGSLFVEGSAEEPVSFTSINDGSHNEASETFPNSFDWNGILIEKDAEEIKMRNFEVLFSVFGIKSKKRNIVLVNGVFRENGQFNFTINDEIMMVEEKLSYSYNVKPLKKSDTTAVKVSEKEKRIAFLSPKKKKQRTGSIVFFGTAGVEVLSAAALFVNYSRYNSKYSTAQTDTEIHNFGRKRDSYKTAGIVTGVSAGLTAAAGILLQYLYRKKEMKDTGTTIKISLYIHHDTSSSTIWTQLCISL